MSVAQGIMQSYGESITINDSPARGFLACLDTDNGQIHKMPLPPGLANGAKYRLMTSDDISEGDIVTHAERSYIVLRVEPVHIFGERSHNECILRLKGGTGDD